tara:strand:+ start:684 stop:950 length:267 start_codon:yes stop_codon:yes gene_type:complete
MIKNKKVRTEIVIIKPDGPIKSIAFPPIIGPMTDPLSKTITKIAVALATSDILKRSPTIVKPVAKIPDAAPPQITRKIVDRRKLFNTK